MKKFVSLISFLATANCQTITLGPRSNYDQPPAATVTASGNHLEIFPQDFSNGIPADGIDVAFGSDLQGAISSTLDGVCADGYSQECSDELAKILDTKHSYTVESRVVGIDDLLVIGGVALLSIVIQAVVLELDKAGQGTPVSYVHVPATDLSQIQSQTATPSSIAIATDSNTVTITPAPSATISSATITTLTADQDGHKSGDIVISLPTAAAQMLEELIYKSDVSGECVNIQLRRRQSSGGDFTAVNDVVDFALHFVPPQQLLNGLGVELGARLPRLVNEAQQASLAAAQALAAGLPEFAGLDSAFVDVLVETAWLGVVTWCANQINDLTELVLSADDYVPDTEDPSDGTEGCPADAPKGKDAPLCKDDNCQGTEGICQMGEYKGCKCLAVITPFSTGGDQALWDSFQFELEGLLSDVGWGCDQNERITLETKDFEGLATAYCQDVDLSKTVEKNISPKDAGLSDYDEYTFTFSWTKKDEETCFDTCTDIYTAFASTSECSYNSHTKSKSGYQDFTCGTAMYNITEGIQGRYVNQGLLNCGTETDQGNANHFTTKETMDKAAEWFCEEQVVKGLRWTPGQVADGEDFIEYHHNSLYYDPMYVTARWIDNPGCPSTDFGGDHAQSMNATCRERFATITNECDTASNGKHWWKQGGTFFRDCVQWSITRDIFLSEQPSEDDSWRPDRVDCASAGDCGDFAKENCSSGRAFCVLAPDSWCWCRPGA